MNIYHNPVSNHHSVSTARERLEEVTKLTQALQLTSLQKGFEPRSGQTHTFLRILPSNSGKIRTKIQLFKGQTEFCDTNSPSQ